MSAYKCKLVPLERLVVGPKGVIESLCNSCETRDCDNPIQPTKMTIFGKPVNWRVFKKSHTLSMVIQCEGYSQSNANI